MDSTIENAEVRSVLLARGCSVVNLTSNDPETYTSDDTTSTTSWQAEKNQEKAKVVKIL